MTGHTQLAILVARNSAMLGAEHRQKLAYVPHADGRGDGVADGDADEVDVLRQRAQPVLGNP